MPCQPAPLDPCRARAVARIVLCAPVAITLPFRTNGAARLCRWSYHLSAMVYSGQPRNVATPHMFLGLITRVPKSLHRRVLLPIGAPSRRRWAFRA